MPWTLRKGYSRNAIQAAFPALEPGGAVARHGHEIVVALVRTKERGWLNEFLPGQPPRLRMEVNRAHPAHVAALQEHALPKHLFWSKNGRDYLYLGTIKYVGLERVPRLGLFLVFELLDPQASVPG